MAESIAIYLSGALGTTISATSVSCIPAVTVRGAVPASLPTEGAPSPDESLADYNVEHPPAARVDAR